ncbi:MAG TPA: carbohydrate-binding family 9-like protein [Chthonomonadales bacterium]|nr:carbohydrate-binding family 9-like protein [Chthonomonadales bacterium]
MAEDRGVPVYNCHHVDTMPAIDGDLTKPPWDDVQPVWLVPADGRATDAFWEEVGEGLLFAEGDPDAKPLDARHMPYQPTCVRACWTATHLLLGFRALDRCIWGRLTRRDDPVYNEEVVEAFLSPTGDVRRYYELELSPRNVVFDARVDSPDLRRDTMTVNVLWDCPGLQTGVRIRGQLNHRSRRAHWWSAEIAVPFAAFPEAHPPRAGDVCRANFYRIDRSAPGEYTAWSPTLRSPADFHVPERFGVLRFVR